MLDNYKKECIALEVIKTLKSRFDNFPEDSSENRNAPFHEAFLNAFSGKFHGKIESIPLFISLCSWLHGLNTTLGQSFFENISHILSDGEKKEFKNLTISQNQQTIIADIMAQLKNGSRSPNLHAENQEIFTSNGMIDKAIPNFTVDVFLYDSHQIIAIELKTVKPNSGVFQGEKEKILRAKAALKNKYPEKTIRYFLGFPFDPLSEHPTGSNKQAFMRYSVDFSKYFHPDEVLLANELWDYLSETPQTMESILEIINAIATPDFMDYFALLNDVENRSSQKQIMLNILKKWRLSKEEQLLEQYEILYNKVGERKDLKRVLQKSPFKNSGEYQRDRYEKLSPLLKVKE